MGAEHEQQTVTPLLSLGLNYEDDEEDALEAELLARAPTSRTGKKGASPIVAALAASAQASDSSDSDVGMELDEDSSGVNGVNGGKGHRADRANLQHIVDRQQREQQQGNSRGRRGGEEVYYNSDQGDRGGREDSRQGHLRATDDSRQQEIQPRSQAYDQRQPQQHRRSSPSYGQAAGPGRDDRRDGAEGSSPGHSRPSDTSARHNGQQHQDGRQGPLGSGQQRYRDGSERRSGGDDRESGDRDRRGGGREGDRGGREQQQAQESRAGAHGGHERMQGNQGGSDRRDDRSQNGDRQQQGGDRSQGRDRDRDRDGNSSGGARDGNGYSNQQRGERGSSYGHGGGGGGSDSRRDDRDSRDGRDGSSGRNGNGSSMGRDGGGYGRDAGGDMGQRRDGGGRQEDRGRSDRGGQQQRQWQDRDQRGSARGGRDEDEQRGMSGKRSRDEINGGGILVAPKPAGPVLSSADIVKAMMGVPRAPGDTTASASTMSRADKVKLLWGAKKTVEPVVSQEVAPAPIQADAVFGANRWDAAEWQSAEDKSRFQRLMGVKMDFAEVLAAGSAAAPHADDLFAGHVAMKKEEQARVLQDVEEHFNAALRRKDGRTVGLGL